MKNLLGMKLSTFLQRLLTEPLSVFRTCLLYWWLRIRMLQEKRRLDSYKRFQKEDLVAANVLIPQIEKDIDYPMKDLQEKVGDTVFVYGENSDGARLVAKITRRKSHNEFWLSFQLPDGRTFRHSCPKKRFPPSGDFTAGGLRIKCRIPLRQFRVSFNGLLREYKEDHLVGDPVHVKFSFICTVTSHPFDLMSDIHPSIMAEFLAKQNGTWLKTNLQSVTDHLDSVIQAINLFGTTTIEGSQEIELTLWGARKRCKDIFCDSGSTHVSEYIGYSKEGQLIYIGEVQLPLYTSKLPFGFLLERTALSWPITDCRLEFKNSKQLDKGIKIQLANDRGSITGDVGFSGSPIEWHGPGSETKIHGTNFHLHDGDEGFGIYVENSWGLGLTNDFQGPAWIIEDRTHKTEIGSLVLPLEKSSCQDSSISGGKGSSLAILTKLCNKYITGFKVPSGFVVTTKAYEEFFLEAGVQASVVEFENNAWSYTTDKIKSTCDELVSTVSKAKLPESVRIAVENQFLLQFPKDGSNRRFAVRSSASGEDSEELSAAGQMSTLLGLEGLENICQAIVKCWASQFSFTAVQYKRQNGQELNSAMAVVVQEMVAAEVAGVLFTCDPVTGNPQNVTITANYGLGESVVSASADPDTLVYHRGATEEVTFKSSLLGKKTMKIVMGDSNSIVESKVDPKDSDSCCLSPEKGMHLARTGLQIESSYGFPLDIEWAYKEDQLYLLQARPITTVDAETKYEVAHASSGPVWALDEYNSKANIGEVLPGAVSHLGLSSMSFLFAFSLDEHFGKRNEYAFPISPYYNRFSTSRNHMFISIPNFFLRFYHKGEQSFLAESNMIAGFGRLLDDQKMFDQADRRNKGYPSTFIPYQMLFFIYDFITCGKMLDRAWKSFWNQEVDFTGSYNSRDMFECLFRNIMSYSTAIIPHVVSSLTSSVYNAFVLGILASNNKGWDIKVYSDFALILSSCGKVESADIPKSMKMLAAEIRRCLGAEKFKEMKTEEALQWLEKSTNSAGKAYKDFISKHGHRCLKEYDVYSKPWRVDRLPLIRTIQDFISQKEDEEKPFVSTDEVLKGLKVPLSRTSRFIMKILIPLCRKGVVYREKSKSLLVKAMDHIRKGHWALAEQLVKEGRLPDKELYAFLSYREVEELISTRSPSLIQRALRRRQIFPELDKLHFPEITKGLPKTIEEESGEQIQEGFLSDLEIKGTPVSQGIVKGLARVATNIDEAVQIKHGEILIAHSTDIAWSPYFPLLSGVATELGGLISHGAVVAREYGLPCVVGVADATRKIKSGDYILLDGNSGVLRRIEKT